MSVTYSIVCKETKERLWIGQGNYLYTGDKEVMDSLTKFLFETMGKTLLFICDDFNDEILDQTEEYRVKND